MDDINEQIKALNNLLLDGKFVELSTLVDEHFNIFNVLKLQNSEIHHSNFMGWLLSPNENHSLNDNFFKEILKILLKRYLNNENLNFSDIIISDFTDMTVTLEKMTDKGRRMDIFLESQSNSFVCVIENKIWSGEGCNQLEDYEKYINSHEKYSKYRHKLFIFLTPNNKESDLEKLYKNYMRLSYEDICNAIDSLLKSKKKFFEVYSEVKYFIENYKEMIERNIMKKKDEKVIKLCRAIKRNHKEALNLINEIDDEEKSRIFKILKEVIQENKDEITVCNIRDNLIECIPTNINNIQKLKFGNSDENDNLIVRLRFMNFPSYDNTLCYELAVDFPKEKNEINNDKKESLEKHLEDENQLNIKFCKSNNGWSHTKREKIIDLDESYSYDNDDDIKNVIKTKLEDIKGKYIKKLKEALDSWNCD